LVASPESITTGHEGTMHSTTLVVMDSGLGYANPE
jgi:hypothetical protein